MSTFSLRRACTVTGLWLFLTGCASVMQAASQIPVVSLVYDAHDAYRLVESITMDDSMSESEIRAMMNRPLPSPPGISFEVALLRHAAAATALGEVELVEQAHRVATQNRGTLTLDFITELVVYANAYSGNIERAKHVSLGLEERYISSALRKGGRPSSWVAHHVMFYTTMMAIAAGVGDQTLFDRLMSQYPDTLDSEPGIDPLTSSLYLIARKANLPKKLAEEGDYEAALRASEQLELLLKDRFRFLRTEAQRRSWQDTVVGIKSELSVMSSLARKPHKALEYIDAMRVMGSDSPSAKNNRARVLYAEAIYLHSVGEHREALQRLDASWNSRLRFFRTGKVAREDYARDRARMQLALRAHEDALASLGTMGPVAAISIKPYRESAIAFGAYANASLGRTSQDLSLLDALDVGMEARIGTDSARLHFAVKSFAHHAAYEARRLEQNLRQAVSSGRQFSRAYRRMRLTGQYGDVVTPVEVFRRAKESYLLSAITAVGRFGVSIDDVLDALSLFYDSDLDEDIAAAALRGHVAGLSDAEVRKLQDLRLAARRASRQLEVVARLGEPEGMQAASAAAEKASQAFADAVGNAQGRAPAFATTFAVPVVSLPDIRRHLLATEALIALAPTAGGTAVVVVTKSGVSHRITPLTSSEADRLVGRVLRSVWFSRSGDVPAFDTAAAVSLYAQLLESTESQLRGTRQLVVVTRGGLAKLPFGLLLTRPASGENYREMAWLIKAHGIAHAPSVASWMSTVSGAGSALRTGSFVAWADPDFGKATLGDSPPRSTVDATMGNPGFRLDRLEETQREAEAIARALQADPTADVILGVRATRDSVLTLSSSGQLRRKSVVMFATHGLESGELSGLTQPALALAKDPTGWPTLLTLDDVVGLRMQADWVLLSACNTSAADRIGGDALSGLARGFFYAGAKRLLVTYWRVESESAATMTVKTIERSAGTPSLSSAQALQHAALTMIGGTGGPAKWAHPAFWAPYGLVGNGR